jgi:hypothetical protein
MPTAGPPKRAWPTVDGREYGPDPMAADTEPAFAQLFLAAVGDADPTAHLDAWASAAAGKAGPVRITVGRRGPDPAEAVLVERGHHYDHSSVAYAELIAPPGHHDDLEAALDGAADAFAGTVDPEQSYVAVGRVLSILEGGGPVVGLHWLRRRPDFTTDAFHEYWSGGHTTHSRSTLSGQLGYRQHHVDPGHSAAAARASGLRAADFDGVSITYSVDLDAHLRVMTGAGASRGMSDNATFVDVDHSPYLTVWHLGTPVGDI